MYKLYTGYFELNKFDGFFMKKIKNIEYVAILQYIINILCIIIMFLMY